MITARELMIGNLLQGTPLNVPRLSLSHDGVTAITAFGIYNIEEGFLSSLKPIPLTEEWLLKFGFEKTSVHEDFSEWTSKDCEFWIIDDGNKGKYIFYSHIDYPFMYVHQLQNACFALCGHELTIKTLQAEGNLQ